MEEKVLITEKPSTSFQVSAATKIICRVCQKQFSQYTCPRCNSRYCSLPCYKSHSIRCTESFMRENVVEEMQHMQPDNQTKQKMLDILKRYHSEEEQMEPRDEDEDFMVSEETIQKVLSDFMVSEETIQKVLSGKRVTLDDLSEEEMKLFRRAMALGELSKLIDPWEPWWLKPSARTISLGHQGTQLIVPVQSKHSVEDDHSSDIPAGPTSPLRPISELSSTPPSPLLAVHLVDIIYSYCFTLRFYNGDWQSDVLGAAMVVLSLSSVLGKGGQPETVSEALGHCLEQTCSAAFRHCGGLQFGLGLVDDIVILLNLGGPALVCLLCDLQRLLQAGQSELRSEKLGKIEKNEMRAKLKPADMKVRFLMCWVHEQPREAWSSLAAIVGVEKKSIEAMFHGDKTKPVQVDATDSKHKVLIEEFQ